jgi:hypothetical protein
MSDRGKPTSAGGCGASFLGFLLPQAVRLDPGSRKKDRKNDRRGIFPDPFRPPACPEAWRRWRIIHDVEKEERDLVERSIRGDRDAFAALYERSFGPVYAFVVAEVSDFDEARSICQETFLRAWNGIQGLKEPAAFGGWIRTFARN